MRIRVAWRYDPDVIPTIGFMIGFYILTRMIQVLGTKGEHVVTRAMAIVTILVVLFGMFDLLTSGMTPTGLPY